MKSLKLSVLTLTLLLSLNLPALAGITLEKLGTYQTGIVNEGASEIVAYDSKTERLFVVNGADSTINVINIVDPANPTLSFTIDIQPFGNAANSVDLYKNIVAAAVESEVKTAPGKVVFFDPEGNFLNSVAVGSLPDMLTFSPNGRTVLVANEGEPNDDYTVDPEGSVSIIEINNGVSKLTQNDVTTVNFSEFNNTSLDPSIRIFGPGATVAQDLEPEFITVSHNSKKAWVTLQENNAVALLDIKSGKFTELIGLGLKITAQSLTESMQATMTERLISPTGM